MDKLQELAKAEKERDDIALRFNHIQLHFRTIENNIALLKNLQLQYLENIKILKRPSSIPVIEEFKKIKSELDTINLRLNVLQIDYNNHKIELKAVGKKLFEADEKYATLLKNQDAPIIKGNFGGKK